MPPDKCTPPLELGMIMSTLSDMNNAIVRIQNQVAGLQLNHLQSVPTVPLIQRAAELEASALTQRAVLGLVPAEDEYVAKKMQTATGCEVTEVVMAFWEGCTANLPPFTPMESDGMPPSEPHRGMPHSPHEDPFEFGIGLANANLPHPAVELAQRAVDTLPGSIVGVP